MVTLSTAKPWHPFRERVAPILLIPALGCFALYCFVDDVNGLEGFQNPELAEAAFEPLLGQPAVAPPDFSTAHVPSQPSMLDEVWQEQAFQFVAAQA